MSETHAPAHDQHAAPDGHAPDGHHGPLQHQFDDLAQQRESLTLGMWLFLATEVMMFGGLFFTYSLYRWKYPGAFEAGSGHLNIQLGTLNTFVLLASSLTMALAVHGATDGKKKVLIFFLGITWLLGAAFIGIKAVEWTLDYNEGLIPAVAWFYYDNPHHADQVQKLAAAGTGVHHVMMYFVIYFCMTGLHAIHMIVGLALVGYFMFLAWRGQFAGGNEQPVEILGLYWHLVDIIWVFLFPLLYLIAGFHPFGKGGGH